VERNSGVRRAIRLRSLLLKIGVGALAVGGACLAMAAPPSPPVALQGQAPPPSPNSPPGAGQVKTAPPPNSSSGLGQVKAPPPPNSPSDPGQVKTAPPPGPAAAAPTTGRAYRLEAPAKDLRELRQRFAPDLLAVLEKLNRADLAHLWRQKTLVVPAEPLLDELQYSPLPLTYAWAAPYATALVVDQPSQAFGAYEGGTLVRWGPVSSGRKRAPTPAGLFHLNWRSPGRTSTEDPRWYMRWYFNFSSARGLAFHQLELPGYPASHACVRLLERDARWIYDWGEGWQLDDDRRAVLQPGTPVLILGQYAFGEPRPWQQLPWLAKGVDLPASPPER
jgi:lipoprotein-anchoring transpeptidase ErfK/SrfK